MSHVEPRHRPPGIPSTPPGCPAPRPKPFPSAPQSPLPTPATPTRPPTPQRPPITTGYLHPSPKSARILPLGPHFPPGTPIPPLAGTHVPHRRTPRVPQVSPCPTPRGCPTLQGAEPNTERGATAAVSPGARGERLRTTSPRSAEKAISGLSVNELGMGDLFPRLCLFPQPSRGVYAHPGAAVAPGSHSQPGASPGRGGGLRRGGRKGTGGGKGRES